MVSEPTNPLASIQRPRQPGDLVFGPATEADEVCDFCSSTPVVKAFPCHDYVSGVLATVGADGIGSASGWAACGPCAAMVDANDVEGLAVRSAELFGDVIGPEIFRQLHDEFFANRYGEGVEV